jgi:hypothetical protein
MTVHVCLSGTPWCAGLNPCPTCHQVMLTRILPHAMVGGGFNGSKEQAQAFFGAYTQARTGVLHELSRLIPPTLNGAEAKFEGVEELPGKEVKESLETPLSDEELSAMAGEPEHPEWEILGAGEEDVPPEVASEPREASYAGSSGATRKTKGGKKLAVPPKGNKKARVKKEANT